MKNDTARRCGMAAILCFVMLLQGELVSRSAVGNHTTAIHRTKPKKTVKSRAVVYAAVSADGHWGASYYGKSKVRIWDKRTGTLMHTVKRPYRDDDGMTGMYHYGGVTAITFSRNGKWLLVKDGYSVGSGGARPSWSADEITVWNTRTGHRFSLMTPDEEDSNESFAFSPDGDTLAYDRIGRYGTSCFLCKINLSNGQPKGLKIFQNEGDVNYGGSTYFTPDGKVYAASGYGPDCFIDVATLRPHVGSL